MTESGPSIPPRRFLFLAEGQLGDLLLLTPALRSVKESFPGSHTTVLVLERRNTDPEKRDRFSELEASPFEQSTSPLSTNPHVDVLLVLSREALRSQTGIGRLRAEISVLRSLRAAKPDAVICTFPEDRFAEWAFATGARMRVGQRNQPLRRLLTHTPDIEKKTHGVLTYYCGLAEALGAKVGSYKTEYHVSTDSQQWGLEALHEVGIEQKNFVVVHPGASGDYKIWPAGRYAELITRLATEAGVTPLLLYGAVDKQVVSAIREHLEGDVKTLETGAHVGRLAAILQRASLCISNDSGPRHLAVAVGTPTLTLFRHHHDREWGIYGESERCVIMKGEGACPACPPDECRDVIPEGEKFGSHCMRMIGVDGVMQHVAGLLAPR